MLSSDGVVKKNKECLRAAADQRKDAGKMGAGLGQANPQAAALVLLVRRYPDTLERLDRISSFRLACW
jgi:hypothetical protein